VQRRQTEVPKKSNQMISPAKEEIKRLPTQVAKEEAKTL
jgi:hypothetical protein